MNKTFKAFSFLVCLLMLAACGGGGSSSQNNAPVQIGTGGSAVGSVAIANTALQFNGTTSISAIFKKIDGTPASGINVNFSTTLGTIAPASGIAVTDATGTATVQLTVGSSSGQGQVTASATVDNKQITKTGLFSVSLPPLKLSAITLGLTTLSFGGSTGVSVTVTDANGVTFTGQEVDVTFSSTQAATGKATISSPVRTVNGVATTTYQAVTASGNDSITAAIAGDSKTVTITVNPLAASSITFVSASPTNIGLKGMGGAGIQESSKVTFKVLDVTGQPNANRQVNFALNTTIGGLALTSNSGSTAADGTVSTTVLSGTIATPVRVTATLAGVTPAIATQSDQLVVSTGVPAQDGFSISIATLNTESWNTDGVTDKVTARLSDHFHNPVPDGTAVSFTASGGSIQPFCTTVGGACSVTWTSQNPRPIKPGSPTGLPSTGAKNDGRAVILAYAVGEEAFLDSNGSGVADGACTAIPDGTGLVAFRKCGEFTDWSEAFRDDNEDGIRQATETFIDFNSDGVFNGPDGRYNGVLQNPIDIAANIPRSKHVFSNSVIVMSSTSPGTVSFSPTNVALTSTTVITLTVTDANGNAMPAGTVITVAAGGSVLTTTFTSTVPNTSGTGNGITLFSVPVTNPSLTAGIDALKVTVAVPSGLSTIYTIPITY